MIHPEIVSMLSLDTPFLSLGFTSMNNKKYVQYVSSQHLAKQYQLFFYTFILMNTLCNKHEITCLKITIKHLISDSDSGFSCS